MIRYWLFSTLLLPAAGFAQTAVQDWENLYHLRSDCTQIMQDAGQLIDVSDIIKETANQLAYMKEFEAFHQRRGTKGLIASSEDTIKTLEGEYGPPITFTTFSRELTAAEHYVVAEQVLGVLSNLPNSGAIITSGGTMGDRSDDHSVGGGVGIAQMAAMNLGFKVLSVTASKAFQYRAAHADFLFFTMGGFSTESRTMYRVSKALVVLGGGGQAYNEALEYLQFNPNGVLVLIDAAGIEGSSKKLLSDPRFAELANNHPNIIIAKNGSEAGVMLTEKLGLRLGDYRNTTLTGAQNGVNRLSPNTDMHLLLPNSKIIGFSGWSNFDRSPRNALQNAREITGAVRQALEKVHGAFLESDNALLYATAGNDPKLSDSGIPAFESYVHQLELGARGKHVAMSAGQMNISELNPKISAVSFIAPTWKERTFQLPVRVDLFVTAGGNETVLEQSIQAATLKRRQLHIMGANTLTDLRVEALKSKNPYLVTLTPAQIEAMSSNEILFKLGFRRAVTISDSAVAKRLGVNAIPEGAEVEVIVDWPNQKQPETIRGRFNELTENSLFISPGFSRQVGFEYIRPGSFKIVKY